MGSDWSRHITRANVSPTTFEDNVTDLLSKIFENDAGSSPVFLDQMRFNRWVLEGDSTQKTIRTKGPNASPCRMDGFTIFGKTARGARHVLDRFGNEQNAVLNFEITTTQSSGMVDYIVKKVDILSLITDAHHRTRTHGGKTYMPSGGTYEDTIGRIGQMNNFKGTNFSTLDSLDARRPVTTLLLFLTNNEVKNGNSRDIARKLDPLWGATPRVTQLSSNGQPVDGAFEIETPGGVQIRIGQVSINELVDVSTTMEALDGAAVRFKSKVTDRFLWDFTRFALGDDNALCMNKKPRSFNSTIKNLAKAGKQSFLVGPLVTPRKKINADVFQFRMKQDDLLELTQIERTIREDESLQRIAVKSHLRGMATSIALKKQFHLPVILVADSDTNIKISGRQKGIRASGGPLKPYGWRVIDGQHRILSGYLKASGAFANNYELDVQIFKFTGNPTDAEVAEATGEIFYDVNYRGVKPPAEVALNHMAKMAKFPYGLEYKGSGYGMSRDLYSSRVHAMRFLQELNDNSLIFKDKFDLFNQGLRESTALGRKLIKPASITTYLAEFFEFGFRTTPRTPWFKSASKSLMWTYQDPIKFPSRSYFHELKDAAGHSVPWGDPRGKITNPSPAHKYGVPTPNELQAAGFYKKLREDFDTFCELIQVTKLGPNGTTTGNHKDAILAWCMEEAFSSAFLPAIFRVFVRFYCSAEPGSSVSFANLTLAPGGLIQRIGKAVNRITIPPNPPGPPKWPVGSGAVEHFEKTIIDDYNNHRSRHKPTGGDILPYP